MSEISLKIIPLGGTTNVTKNIYVYEYGEDIIIVDCGVGFPDSSDYGVDLVIPDFSYILKNKHKVRALLVTHGHEDHFGAVPFLLNELNIPVYATKLVLGFIQNKLNDHGIKNAKLITIDRKSPFEIGPFKITPISVNHSVPDSVAFAIETNEGVVLHVSDFKFDWTPVMDPPFDVFKLTQIADKGIDLLLSDSLGSTSKGYTESERYIEQTFNELMSKAKAQVFITTMSSNISRIQQAINASLKFGRKVVISGRSIEQNLEVATKLGYLSFPENTFVKDQDAKNFARDKLTHIVAGSYGQTNSALYRMAMDKHRFIKIEKDATVIFSADPNPPGVLELVNFVIDKLTLIGAEVLYSEIQDSLHVSGHGSRGDLSMLAVLAHPKYLVPIGGTVKFMRAYVNLMTNMGFSKDTIFELLDGESIFLKDKKVFRGEKVYVGNIYVDGSGIGDVGSIVLRDRQELADSGMMVIAIPYKREKKVFGDKIAIVSRGFVYVKEAKHLIREIENRVRSKLRTNISSKDIIRVKADIEKDVAKFIYKETERNPIVLVITVEV
ncbi:MAG: ribonuclease J [bacterium]